MKIAITFCSTIFVLALSKSLYARELKIGYFEAPPFVILSKIKAKPNGVVIEMWEEIAKEMGDTITWKQMPIARLIYELKNNRLDASSLFVPTPAREVEFHFSNNRWDLVQPGVAVKVNFPLKKLKDPSDLIGLKIGSSSKSVITPWFKNNNIKFHNISGMNFVERLLKQLISGRIHGVYWPSIYGMKFLMNKLQGIHKVRFLRSPLGPYPIKVMFPKTDMGMKTAFKFDEAFLKVKKRFDFQRVKETYVKALK
jgi:ABC-type amino acid transport substrate-binding protein